MNNKSLNLAHYYINEYIDEHELVWQLKEIKDKGFNGLILSPAKGLAIGFMSPEWISITNFILLICDDIELTVYLSTDAVNPTNILEAKYHFEEIDYKLFYLSLKDSVDIKEVDSLEIGKEDIFFAMKKDGLGELDPSSAMEIELNSHELKKLKNKNVSIVKFSISNQKRTPNDLYPFNFLIKNTTQEFVEKVYKKCYTIFSKYTSFAGFYEPRLFPKVKGDAGVIWNDLLVKDFNKESGIDLSTIIPELFFSKINKYQNIREKYDKFILSRYKKNFIDVVEKFITDNNIKIIYQFDALDGKKKFDDYYDFSPLFDLNEYIGKESIVAYFLPYMGNLEIDRVAALFFQSLKSLNIVKNSLAIITDKHHRFNFTPHRFANLKKNALIYNVQDTVTESFLYSIKGFRKNDIVPNIFYQNRFWKYMNKVNTQVASIVENDFAELEGYDPCYDFILVYSNIERYNIYSSNEYDHTYYNDFVSAVKSTHRSIFIIPSDKLDLLKLKKSKNKLSFAYADNGEIINTNRLVMIYGDRDSAIDKWYDKNSPKIDILKVCLKKDETETKLKIFNKDKIYEYLTDFTVNNYKISTRVEDNIFINKLCQNEENEKYLIFNQNDYPCNVKFTDSLGAVHIHEIENCGLKILNMCDIETPVKEEKTLSSYKIILKNNWQFNPNASNILPLTQWLFKVGGPKDELIGTVHYFETMFISNIIPSKLFLILDGVYGEKDSVSIDKPVKILVNNNEVDYNFQKLESAHTLYKLDICKLVVKGENKIVIKSKGAHFAPITLNEPQFLEGDFAIRKKLNYMWVIDKQDKPLFDGNWVDNGYPYYSGVGEFTQFFDIEKNFKKIMLKIGNYDYPLEVTINGEYVTSFAAPPYEYDVTKFINEGRNKLLVTIPSSVANIFTGIKLPEGMTGEISFEVY